jgi:hypothetical protein
MIPTKHEVVALIREAFAGVTRGNGVTLHEADMIDSYGSAHERAQSRKLDRDVRWQDVPAADIVNNSHVLSFLDHAGFHYYYPHSWSWD